MRIFDNLFARRVRARYRLINYSGKFSRGSYVGSCGPSQRTKNSTVPNLCTRCASISSTSQRWKLKYFDNTSLLFLSSVVFLTFPSSLYGIGALVTRSLLTHSTTSPIWIVNMLSFRFNNAYGPMELFTSFFPPHYPGRCTRSLRFTCLDLPATLPFEKIKVPLVSCLRFLQRFTSCGKCFLDEFKALRALVNYYLKTPLMIKLEE